MSLCGCSSHEESVRKSLPKHARNSFSRNDISYHMRRLLLSKGTHTCACRRGSYTLEAAVVLPLLVGACTVCLFFFRVLQVQTQVQEALTYASRKTACEASISSSPVVLMASAEVYLQKQLATCDTVKQYVTGGQLGVSVLRSEVSEKQINLRAEYYIKFPINFFGWKGWYVSQHSNSRKWVGDRQASDEEIYVYVTENGSVYHTSRSCHYLDLSIQKVNSGTVGDLRNKDGHIYYACLDCVAKNSKTETKYITDYGVCYHDSLLCSGLKRTIYMVKLSEVKGKGKCSKCVGT